MSFVGAIGIIKYIHLTTPLKYIDWYIIYWVITGWIEHVLASYFHIHNLWLFHFNTLIGLLLVLLALYHWRTSDSNGKLIQWSFCFYMIIWIIGKFTFEPLTRSDDYSGSIAQLIQIGFSVWILMAVLRGDSVIWKKDPRFWVTSGIVLYNVATLLSFGMFNAMLDKSISGLKMISYLNWYAIILVFGFFLRSLFCKPERTSQDLVVGATGDLRNQKIRLPPA